MDGQFGELNDVDPRSIWPNEALDFTPWLAQRITALGEALGMDLELEQQEADVGDFSLDLLAKDLGTGQPVVIENQLNQTDHDHLGKLLTYAGGFDAQTVIWVARSLREEHRQALEWLNQVTAKNICFFGVTVEVFRIDASKPAFRFRPLVFPNQWQKSRRATAERSVSSRGQAYQSFFQSLIDELRETHRFTGARAGQPQNWYSFSSGINGINYSASFAQGDRIRTEIYIDTGDKKENEALLAALQTQQVQFQQAFREPLSWEQLPEKRACRVAAYRDGSIESNATELSEIHRWVIDKLLTFKRVFNEPLTRLRQNPSLNPGASDPSGSDPSEHNSAS